MRSSIEKIKDQGFCVTIDERLERLTHRREALTQSVELMHLEGQEQAKRIDKILVAIQKDGEKIDKIIVAIERTVKTFTAWRR